jgi:hypothetical protein
MTDQQIRLQFGEMNASEMRLARSIVNLHEGEIESLKAEAAMWKANHDNQVKLKSLLINRPDLGDRAPRIQKLLDENAKLRAGIAEAYKIIDVLYMDALDNHKESWPRAQEWMEEWKENLWRGVIA